MDNNGFIRNYKGYYREIIEWDQAPLPRNQTGRVGPDHMEKGKSKAEMGRGARSGETAWPGLGRWSSARVLIGLCER